MPADAPAPGGDVQLDYVRVLEFGSSLSLAYLGWLLASLGCRVEIAGPEAPGDIGPHIQGAVERLRHGRARVPYPSQNDELATVKAFLAAARPDEVSVVIADSNAAVGLADHLTILTARESCVAVVLDDRWQDGASEKIATHLTLSAAAGWLHQSGEPDGEPLAIGSATYGPTIVGAMGAVGALAGIVRLQRTGRGAFISLNEFDAYYAGSRYHETSWDVLGHEFKRRGNGTAVGNRIVPTADGHVFLGVMNDPQWRLLMTLAGVDAETSDAPDQYLEITKGQVSDEESRAAVDRWCAGQSKWDVAQVLQECRIPAAPILSPAEGMQAEHRLGGGSPNRALDIMVSPMTFRRAGEDVSSVVERPGPSTGTRSASSAALLAGLRVIDLTAVWAGPFATWLLAGLGAEVWKVESPTRPEFWRSLWASTDSPQWMESSPLFQAVNAGKLGITLDLRTPQGHEVLHSLCGAADILIDNFTPRVMPSLGLGWDDVSAKHDHLVMVSGSGYGVEGPFSDWLSTASVGDAMSGVSWASGPGEDTPLYIGGQHGDPLLGSHMAAASLAGIVDRYRTGRGSYASVSQFQASLLGMFDGVGREDAPFRGNGHPDWTPHGAFLCSDGEWLALVVRTDREWQSVCEALGIATILGKSAPDMNTETRRAHQQAIQQAVAASVGTFPTSSHVEVALASADVPVSVVEGPISLINKDVLFHRSLLERVETAGGYTTWVPRGPLVVDGVRVGPTVRAPMFGEHDGHILKSVVGLSDDEIAALRADGVVVG